MMGATVQQHVWPVLMMMMVVLINQELRNAQLVTGERGVHNEAVAPPFGRNRTVIFVTLTQEAETALTLSLLPAWSSLKEEADDIKNTPMSHVVALGHILLHHHEHTIAYLPHPLPVKRSATPTHARGFLYFLLFSTSYNNPETSG